jgi:hypothetical protein
MCMRAAAPPRELGPAAGMQRLGLLTRHIYPDLPRQQVCGTKRVVVGCVDEGPRAQKLPGRSVAPLLLGIRPYDLTDLLYLEVSCVTNPADVDQRGPSAQHAAIPVSNGAAAAANQACVALHNGVSMPLVGFGIAQDQETLNVALRAGYRLMDTARIYRDGEHERDIGAVLGSGRWNRSDVFVTTKTSSTGPAENAYSE